MSSVVIPDFGDANKRDATFQYHERTFVSLNRLNPLSTSPSSYSINIGGVDNVDAIQLGAVALDPSARYGIDTYRRHFRVSDPILLRTLTTISIVETIVNYNNTQVSGLGTYSASTGPVVSVTIPPTFNTITTASTSGGFTTVTTALNHCLGLVQRFWPLTPSIVGSRYYGYDPTLSSAVLVNGTRFALTNSYIASLNYSDTAGSTPLASVSDALGNAYVYTPPLLVSEAVRVVNSVFESLTSNGALRASYGFSFNSVSDCVELRVQNSEKYQGTTRTEITASLTVVPGDLLWYLGFDSMNSIPRFASFTWGTSQRENISEAVVRGFPRVVRTYELPIGNYSSSETCALVRDTANGVFFSSSSSATERSVVLHHTDGQAFTITFSAGWYSPVLFASVFSLRVNEAPHLGYTVTINTVSNRYTVANTNSAAFGLDWSLSPSLARMAGFEPIQFSGMSSYTSSMRAAHGYSGAPIETTTMATHPRPYALQTMSSQRTFRFSAVDPSPSFWVNSAAPAPPTADFLSWFDSTTVSTFSVNAQEGQVIRVTDTLTSLSYSFVVTDPSPASAPHQYTVNTGAVEFDVNKPLNTSDMPFSAQRTDRNAFMLHMSTLSDAFWFPQADLTGVDIDDGSLSTEPRGSTRVFGSLFTQLGFKQVVYSVPSGALVAPHVHSLDPPDTIYIGITYPNSSNFATFTPTHNNGNTVPILATLYVGNGFVRISKEFQTLLFSSFPKIDRLGIVFLDEDGRLVDFHGANNRCTLILRCRGGNVSGGSM